MARGPAPAPGRAGGSSGRAGGSLPAGALGIVSALADGEVEGAVGEAEGAEVGISHPDGSVAPQVEGDDCGGTAASSLTAASSVVRPFGGGEE